MKGRRLAWLAGLWLAGAPAMALARPPEEPGRSPESQGGEARSSAEPADEAPTLLGYGFRGMLTGSMLGLATGYLAIGPEYTKGEWRKLVVGTGAGALTGLFGGIALAVVDNGKPAPTTGWLVMRDADYGCLLGVFSGAAIGALYWAGGGHPKNVLTGAAIGTLAGAVVGGGFGVYEGVNRPRERSSPSTESAPRPAPAGVQLTLMALPSGSRVPGVGPLLYGRF